MVPNVRTDPDSSRCDSEIKVGGNNDWTTENTANGSLCHSRKLQVLRDLGTHRVNRAQPEPFSLNLLVLPALPS